MNINEMTLNQFATAKFNCDCGKTHSIETRYIRFGENTFCETKQICEKFCQNASVLLICEKQKYLQNQELFKKYLPKYKVFFPSLQPNTLDLQKIQQYSNMNIVVSFGDEKVCDLAKIFASNRMLPHVAIASNIGGEIFCKHAYLFEGKLKKRFLTKPPVAVVVDLAMLCDNSFDEIAGGFAYVLSKLSKLFDWKISRLAKRDYFCKTIHDFIYNRIVDTLQNCKDLQYFSQKELQILCENWLKISLATELLQTENDNVALLCMGAENFVADLLQPQFPATYPELVFLAEEKLFSLYKLFFEQDFDLPFYPPDTNKRAEVFAKNFNVNENSHLKSLVTGQKADLHVATHLLKQNLPKIKLKLAKTEKMFASAKKIFFSLYPDGGLHLQNVASTNNLRFAFCLAPDICENYSTLHLMRDFGRLEAY